MRREGAGPMALVALTDLHLCGTKPIPGVYSKTHQCSPQGNHVVIATNPILVLSLWGQICQTPETAALCLAAADWCWGGHCPGPWAASNLCLASEHFPSLSHDNPSLAGPVTAFPKCIFCQQPLAFHRDDVATPPQLRILFLFFASAASSPH